MAVPSRTCDRCGYAVDLRRVMFYVEGRPMNEHTVCTRCLWRVFDVFKPEKMPA